MRVPIQLQTMTEVARTLGVAPARFWRLIEKGIITPDFRSSAALLFRPETAAALARRVAALEKAIAQ